MKNEKFSIIKRFKSFKYAFNGIKILILKEHNSRIHLFAAIVVMVAGFYFRISKMEWIALVIAISMVVTVEIFNSMIEKTCDILSPERRESVKEIKDMGAGAVLIASVFALVIGLIIFLPKIFWN